METIFSWTFKQCALKLDLQVGKSRITCFCYLSVIVVKYQSLPVHLYKVEVNEIPMGVNIFHLYFGHVAKNTV